MSKTRKALIVAAMWVMGLTMLGLLGWVVQVRDSTPVEASTTSAAGVDGSQAPLAALARGGSASARTAAQDLAQGPGSKASHALEAAHRVSEVGMENSWGLAKEQFTIAEKQLLTAMESLHDGRTSGAYAQVRAAATALQRATTAAAGQHPAAPPKVARAGYDSADLLNAEGSKIGLVKRIETQGGKPVAVLQIGGTKDLFGVLELGGKQIEVPAERLLWGPRRSLGYVWVVAPTTATDSAGIFAGLHRALSALPLEGEYGLGDSSPPWPPP
ncbi:hypothetical protein ABZ092_38395 [Streptomyces bobili]|uniref:hypothetical protein n=1 Tax=Streptomyces bobili TaxID=67280 RepID=UPI0033A2BA6C